MPKASRVNSRVQYILYVMLCLVILGSPVFSQRKTEDPVIPSDVFSNDENPQLFVNSAAPSASVCVPGLGGRLFSTGTPVEIVVLQPVADFTSQIKLFAPGPVRTLASSRDIGKVVYIGPFPNGIELVFGITVVETGITFKIGPGYRNPDRVPHAIVECQADGSAVVRFEDKLNSDHVDYNDVRFLVRAAPSPGRIVFKPPFQFFNGCNDSRQFGEASANIWSRPITGDLHVAVQTTFVGEAFGRAGAGVVYVPTFTGRARIRAFVRINPPSSDALYALDPNASVIALFSDVYVKTDGSAPAIDRFRNESINTLEPGGKDLLGLLLSLFRQARLARLLIFVPTLEANSHVYRPGELYVANLETTVTAGLPVRICGGLQSSALSTSVPAPFFAGVSARYEAQLIEIVVEPQ